MLLKSSWSCGGTEKSLTMAPTDPADLAGIRLCEGLDCKFLVNNAVQDLKYILQAMSNHILSMHPVSGSSDGRGRAGGAKSNAAIPALEEECNQIQWSAWCACFERWQPACKISDKQVENRILEAIPNQIVDQIVVGLVGNKTKADLMKRIKECMVKQSIFFISIRFSQDSPESRRAARALRGKDPPCLCH